MTHKSIIVDLAKTVGLQVVLDGGSTLILGDEVFALEFSEMYPSFTYPYILPPYGVVIAIAFDDNDEVEEAYKRVDDKVVGTAERLQQVLRMIEANSLETKPIETSGRKPIFLLSPEGKTTEELADEAWEAVLKWREAKAKGEDFQPVIDIDHGDK